MLRHGNASLDRNIFNMLRRPLVSCVVALTLTTVAAGVSRSLLVAAMTQRVSVLPQALSTAHVRDAARVTETVGWRLNMDALEVTRDSGATWSNATPENVRPNLIRAVAFNDPLDGWLVTSEGASSGGSDLVAYHTTDGGRSWLSSQVAPPSADFADATAGRASIDFLDAQHGWIEVERATSSAFSAGDLFQTKDGGITWSQVKSPVAGAVAFATPTDGWLAGGVDDAQLFSTHDGGQTWSASAPPLPTSPAAVNVTYTLATRAGTVGLRADFAGNPASALLFDLTPQDSWRLVQSLEDSSSGEPGVAVPVSVAGAGALATVLGRGQETVVSPIATGNGTRMPSNLPINSNAAVSRLSFVSQHDGWAIVSGGACTRFKADCTTYSALYTTSDGGATWTQLSR